MFTGGLAATMVASTIITDDHVAGYAVVHIDGA
jgi:hypothetical protein